MADFINAFRDIETPESLFPCSSCGRKFISDTLLRHEKICSNLKKRKTFDSSKQRTAEFSETERAKALNPTITPVKSKKNNWKLKHEDFINTIRSARGVTTATKTGGPLPPPPPPRIDPDLVQCPHCSRRFNEHAAERHIQFCKEQKSRIGRSPGSASSVAAQRVAARTKYKPPPLAKRPLSGPSSATKTRQTKPKNDKASPLESNYISKQGERPMPNRHQENGSKYSRQSSTTKQGKQEGSGRTKSTGVDSSTTSRMQPKTNINGQKAYYSNRYKTVDNQIGLDNSKYDREVNKTKEIKYGRRASKPKEWEDTTDFMDELSTLQDIAQGSATDRKTKRNAAAHDDPKIDDYSRSDKPSSVNKKTPFPPKPQVHRTNIRNHNTEDLGRLSKFCHECGTKYPVTSAKFCCECGTRRLHIC